METKTKETAAADVVLKLAALQAPARLDEIKKRGEELVLEQEALLFERQAILRTFPALQESALKELQRTKGWGKFPAPPLAAPAVLIQSPVAPARRTRPMSDAQRKAISLRVRKYWKAWRAKKAASQS